MVLLISDNRHCCVTVAATCSLQFAGLGSWLSPPGVRSKTVFGVLTHCRRSIFYLSVFVLEFLVVEALDCASSCSSSTVSDCALLFSFKT